MSAFLEKNPEGTFIPVYPVIDQNIDGVEGVLSFKGQLEFISCGTKMDNTKTVGELSSSFSRANDHLIYKYE
ncbi:hypothetical protein DID80_05325 [Candidatus Marinamargulisbacteria bacterium SCGC AAA071-K20]|nr:hypothetical protein DID80_05325 [Candidatus Marinamargulisbacteria bacterium SCGC AAA071-K20]